VLGTYFTKDDNAIVNALGTPTQVKISIEDQSGL